MLKMLIIFVNVIINKISNIFHILWFIYFDKCKNVTETQNRSVQFIEKVLSMTK